MTRGGVEQLDLYPLADPAAYADQLCICRHYGIEHDMRHLGQPCRAQDLFGQPCDCPGYEPDPDYEDNEQ